MPAESLTHIPATFLQKIRLDGFLSFAPGSDALELRPLNVLIGPNASGKSNLIERASACDADEFRLKYIDERNAQRAANVKRAIRKVIELIGQFPHGGSSIGEEEVRVVPVGHYPYAVYWLVTRREAVILHIRHTPRRGGGVGAFSSSRVSEIAACRMASLSGSGWLVLYAKRKRSSRDHTACISLSLTRAKAVPHAADT
jgi:plasmid stabilization system protein ParE